MTSKPATSRRPPKAQPARSIETGDAPGHVLRTLTALELLAGRSLSVDQLAKSLRVHRRTAARMLDVMYGAHWVESDPGEDGRFRLTPAIVSVAGSVLERLTVTEVAAASVRRLRDIVGESSHVAIPSNGWAVQVVEVQSSQPLAVTTPIGERVPMHASAIGKALLAFRPEELPAALSLGLVRFTPNTITARVALEKELRVTRARGFAVDDGELYPGTRCIAAPVRGADGEVIAAIGVSGPAFRMTKDQMDSHARAVVRVAMELSRAMGHHEKRDVARHSDR